jgi:hypothetical protein
MTPFPRHRKEARGRSSGFAMAEILLGSSILAVVMVSVISLLNRQVDFTKRTSGIDAIDAAVATDLNWIRGYAKYWELAAGPYNLTFAQTGADPTTYGRTAASSIVSSSFLLYLPAADDCDFGTMPQSFVTMAASAAVASIGSSTNPIVRPNPIPTTSGIAQAITLPASVASSYTLQRTINFTGLTNRIRVVYSLSGKDASTLPYPREASILLEAAPWCVS